MLPVEVSVADAARLLAAGAADTTGLHVVDCRDPEEFAFNRLPGAELLSLSLLAAEAPGRLPDKAAPILVYCHHGMRSARAAVMLRQMGYEKAQSVAGGIDAWSREVDPTVPRY